ncbi:MAG TPA: ABC transporter permease [Candidatus Binatia bacterium]|jgi:cell division transport system permease protein
MKISQVLFVFRRVFRSFQEVLSTHLLTSGTMAMTLFIFGGFLLAQENLQGLFRGWGSRIHIFAYLGNRLAASEAESLVQRVRAYPEIESVRFISQREAWESFKKSLGSQSGVLEGLSADTLPASLEIALKPGHRDHDSVAGAVERLRAEKAIDEVEYPQEWTENFTALMIGIEWAKWILGGFLFLATLLIVVNTVKLAIVARREEIEIMQLVGAPAGVVKMPFVIEGMLQGLFGAALSLVALWLAFLLLQAELPQTLAVFTARDGLRFLAPESMALLFCLGWVMGAFAGFFSISRFLPR